MPLKSQGNILKSMIYLVHILIKDPNWHKLVLPANLEFIHKEWNKEEKKDTSLNWNRQSDLNINPLTAQFLNT